MATPEGSLLNDARANLEAQRHERQQQREADEKLLGIYKQIAEFLENQPGSRVSKPFERAFHAIFSFLLVPLARHTAKRRITFKDFISSADHRHFQTTLNGTGEPIKASASANNAYPTRYGGGIELAVEGLHEVLVLNEPYLEQESWRIPGHINKGTLGDLGIGFPARDVWKRRANLQDANAWQLVADGITGKQSVPRP